MSQNTVDSEELGIVRAALVRSCESEAMAYTCA